MGTLASVLGALRSKTQCVITSISQPRFLSALCGGCVRLPAQLVPPPTTPRYEGVLDWWAHHSSAVTVLDPLVAVMLGMVINDGVLATYHIVRPLA